MKKNGQWGTWWLNLLVPPLLVGLTVMILTFWLPTLWQGGMELSHTIDGPTKYLDEKSLGQLKVEVNGVSTSNLVAYKARLWNSGSVPLKSTPVRFVFETDNQSFRIFSVQHNTLPPVEFGEISQENIDNKSIRFMYTLLNPKDEDVVTFLTNDTAKLSVFAKSEGVRFVAVAPQQKDKLWDYIRLVGSAIGALASLITVLYIQGARKFAEAKVEVLADVVDFLDRKK